MKETKDDTNRWKDTPCSWTGGINIFPYYPRQIQRNSYQNTNGTVHRIRINNSKICMKTQKTPKKQNNLKNKAEGIMLPGFKLYYKATIIQTVWYWHKNRHIDQWKQTESSEIKPMDLWSINLQQRRQEYTEGEKTSSSINGVVGKTGQLQAKESNWTTLRPYTKINLKWIKNLNIRPESMYTL